jgi:hypothetical protein
MQAIKALRPGPLHSHLVRDRSKIVPELYKQFVKFNKSEVQHFRKLEQLRKTPKQDKAPRPRYNDNQHNYPKPVHRINSDGCGPAENKEKNFEPPPQEMNHATFDHRSAHYNQRGDALSRGRGCSRGRGPYTFKPAYCMFHGSETNHRTKDCPIFLESKRKMEQDSKQSPQQSSSKEVNHTMQWTPHYHQYSLSYPLLFCSNPTKAAKPNLVTPTLYKNKSFCPHRSAYKLHIKL